MKISVHKACTCSVVTNSLINKKWTFFDNYSKHDWWISLTAHVYNTQQP